MKFRTELNVETTALNLTYGESVVSIGSCFSVNMGNMLTYYGFEVNNNPFGTLFHPSAIARVINLALDSSEERFCERDNTLYSYDAHSSIFAASEDELGIRLENIRNELIVSIQKSRLCLVTFGSAWGYYLEGKIVANCHKMPSRTFEKRLTPLGDMIAEWSDLIEKIKKLNPKIEFIFSVSPVRHLKDGMIENTLSKARLIELVHAIDGYYFPAYELMIDDLRDYRFYSEDMLHPTSISIDYIFEKFSNAVVSNSSLKLFKEIKKLRNAENHRVVNKDSKQGEAFIKQTKENIETFLKNHPQLKW